MMTEFEIDLAKSYADSLDAHLDEGGKYNTSNVRDLIKYIQRLVNHINND